MNNSMFVLCLDSIDDMGVECVVSVGGHTTVSQLYQNHVQCVNNSETSLHAGIVDYANHSDLGPEIFVITSTKSGMPQQS